MTAHPFCTALSSEPRLPRLARARPASCYLMMKEFLVQNPALSESWDADAEELFRQFRLAPVQKSHFAYMSTSLKRMIAMSIRQRLAAGIPVPEELQTMHHTTVKECLEWLEVPSAPSKKLLPAFRKSVKDAYGVRLSSGGNEVSWTVPVGRAACTTVVTFGGHFCQFSYERYVTFPDAPGRQIAMSWEECLGEVPTRWDLMTGDTMTGDLELFFTFAREMEDRILPFAGPVD